MGKFGKVWGKLGGGGSSREGFDEPRHFKPPRPIFLQSSEARRKRKAEPLYAVVRQPLHIHKCVASHDGPSPLSASQQVAALREGDCVRACVLCGG